MSACLKRRFFTSIVTLIALVSLAACASKRKAELAALPTSDRSVHLLFGSCHDPDKGQNIWNVLKTENADLMIMMGDNVYAPADNIGALKKAYDKTSFSQAFREFKNQTPLIATWDDHDYGRNDGGADFPFKEDSKALFLDFFDEPANSERRLRPGIYDSFIVGPPGSSLQVILLDTRSFRSPLERVRKVRPGQGPYGPTKNVYKTILGKTQWKWLEEQLAQPADVRIIVSSIQVMSDEHGFETWGNFPHERRRLYKLIKNTPARAIVILSGDRHHASFWEREDVRQDSLYELTSSSLNRPLVEHYQIQSREPDQITDLEFEPNYGNLIIDWEREVIEASIKLMDGTTAHQLMIPFEK